MELIREMAASDTRRSIRDVIYASFERNDQIEKLIEKKVRQIVTKHNNQFEFPVVEVWIHESGVLMWRPNEVSRYIEDRAHAAHDITEEAFVWKLITRVANSLGAKLVSRGKAFEGDVKKNNFASIFAISLSEIPGISTSKQALPIKLRNQVKTAIENVIMNQVKNEISDLQIIMDVERSKKEVAKFFYTKKRLSKSYDHVAIVAGFKWKYMSLLLNDKTTTGIKSRIKKEKLEIIRQIKRVEQNSNITVDEILELINQKLD